MNGNNAFKFLFVINAVAGANNISWQDIISNYFTGKECSIDYFLFGETPDAASLGKYIADTSPDKVIAVGGDGTVTLVAKVIAGTNAALGILPAGSANGMAKELNIPEMPDEALYIIENGVVSNCDAIKINNKDICLHLADIGLNAQLIKYFDEGKLRGKLGYAKVILKTLWRSQKMDVNIQSKENEIRAAAFMVVLANASKYGTGAVINPEGRLDDGAFEVVVVHKLSIFVLLKMLFRPKQFNPKNIEIFHATSVKIETKRKVHFQIDGEYMGKINNLQATILPNYINIILPEKGE